MRDQQTREQFIRLRGEGRSFRDIAEELGVSKTTLLDWSKEFAQEIANLREMERDALRRQYGVAVEARIRALGQTLRRMIQEIERRDVTDVPTSDLLALVLKYEHALRAESEKLPEFAKRVSVIDRDADFMTTEDKWQA